jgi:hypothetical protein
MMKLINYFELIALFVSGNIEVSELGEQKCNNYKEVDQLSELISQFVNDDIDVCEWNEQKCENYNEIDQQLGLVNHFY